MAVIYLQGPRRWSSLGESVGNAAGAWYQKNEREKEQQAVLDAINRGAGAEELTGLARTPTSQKYLQNYLSTKGSITQNKLAEDELTARPAREARAQAREDRGERREVRQEDIARQTLQLHQLQFQHTLEQDPMKQSKMKLEMEKLQTDIARGRAQLTGQQFENKMMEQFFKNNPNLMEGLTEDGGNGTKPEAVTVPTPPTKGGVPTETPKPQSGSPTSKPPDTLAESSSAPLYPVADQQPLGYLRLMQNADPEFRTRMTQIAMQATKDPEYKQTLQSMNVAAKEGYEAAEQAARAKGVEVPTKQEDRPSIRIGKGAFSVNIPAQKSKAPHKMDDFEINAIVNEKYLVDNLDALRNLVSKNPDLVGPINQFITKGSMYFPGKPNDPEAQTVVRVSHNILAGIKALGTARAGVQIASMIQDILPKMGHDAHGFLSTIDQSLALLHEQSSGRIEAYKASNIAYPPEYMQKIIDGAKPVIYDPKPGGGWNVVRSIQVGKDNWTAEQILEYATENHREPEEVVRVLRRKAAGGGGNPG